MSTITDWLMVVITLIYVLATIAICVANFKSANASRDQTLESKRQFAESKRLEQIPYLQAEFRRWPLPEERNNYIPDLHLTISHCDYDKSVSSGTGLLLRNIGLGMAHNLSCEWRSDTIKTQHRLPFNLLRCENEQTISIVFTGERCVPTASAKATLSLLFDDLLGNHYRQDLIISMDLQAASIKVCTYDMVPPILL